MIKSKVYNASHPYSWLSPLHRAILLRAAAKVKPSVLVSSPIPTEIPIILAEETQIHSLPSTRVVLKFFQRGLTKETISFSGLSLVVRFVTSCFQGMVPLLPELALHVVRVVSSLQHGCCLHKCSFFLNISQQTSAFWYSKGYRTTAFSSLVPSQQPVYKAWAMASCFYNLGG